MAKVWQVLGIVGVIALLLFFWLKHERTGAKNEVKIEVLEQENKGQNEIIKINTVQKKLVSNSIINNDVFARTEWLRLYFEEQAAD